ncbi:MAG: aminoacyl-tRNA hydrolase [Cellulomonadaceae bacterium]|nr:aminoacyl-tRNA hydrolase [Cellulomonadaceae bacterium]
MSQPAFESAGPYLVIGLGNPGAQYVATRHNIGQLVVDLLAARTRVTLKKTPRISAEVAETRLASPPAPKIILAKSLTFMNLTGGPVAALSKYYKVAPDQVIAVHDDVDLPFGAVRLKLGGGEGGHNGLRDITKALGTREYLRVRLGVGRPPGNQDTADYVLNRFSARERVTLAASLDDGADAVVGLVSNGLLATQQDFHSRVH